MVLRITKLDQYFWAATEDLSIVELILAEDISSSNKCLRDLSFFCTY